MTSAFREANRRAAKALSVLEAVVNKHSSKGTEQMSDEQASALKMYRDGYLISEISDKSGALPLLVARRIISALEAESERLRKERDEARKEAKQRRDDYVPGGFWVQPFPWEIQNK